MTCREISEFLAEYLAGELPAAQRRIFERHLAECDDCAVYLRTYEQAIRATRQAYPGGHGAEPPVPDSLVRAIAAARRR